MSAFKMTKEEINLQTDIEMYKFFERSIRDGMCFTNKRRVRSGMTTIDNKQYTNHLGYFDENNFCGLAMC